MTGRGSSAILLFAMSAPALGVRDARRSFRVACAMPSDRNSRRRRAPPPRSPARRGPLSIDRLRYWNQIAIDASGLDHTPVAPGETRVFGEQIGPGRSSRAMAIVHIAMFDAVNAVGGDYQSYTGLPARAPTHRSTRPSRRPRTIRWSRCFRRRPRSSTRCATRTSMRSRAAVRIESRRAWTSGARGGRSPRAACERSFAAHGALWADYSAEPRRGIGGRTPSPRLRSRSGGTGAR